MRCLLPAVLACWAMAAGTAVAAEPPDVHQLAATLIAELKSPDAFTREAAAMALEDLGAETPEAIPALTAAARDKSPDVAERAAYALGKFGAAAVPSLVSLLKDAAPDVRAAAAAELRDIGTAAKDATEPLIALMLAKDADLGSRVRAVEAVGKVGPPPSVAIPALLKLLDDKDVTIRSCAVFSIGDLGPTAKEVLPELIKLTSHADPKIRAAAAGAMGELGAEGKSAAPLLKEMIVKGDTGARVAAGRSLWKIAPPHGGDAVELLRAISSPKDEERWLAAWGLCHTDKSPDMAKDALIKALGDRDARVRRFAVEALTHVSRSRIGDEDPDVDRLAPLVDDPDPKVRQAAVGAIVYIGERKFTNDRESILKAMKDPDIDVRRAAVGHPGQPFGFYAGGVGMYMGEIPQVPVEAIERRRELTAALVPFLADPDEEIHEGAIESIGDIGEGAEAAVPQLARILREDPDPKIRHQAAWSLSNIGPSAKEAIPALIKALDDTDTTWSIPDVAARALGNMKGEAKAAVPQIIKVMFSPRSGRNIWAWRALAEMGPCLPQRFNEPSSREPITPEVVPAFIEALKSDRVSVRRDAAKAMKELGINAKAGVPALRENLKGHCWDVQVKAAEALRAMGDEPGPSVEAMMNVVRYGRGYTRSQACDELRYFGKAAKSAERVLVEAMKTEKDEFARHSIVSALACIGPTEPSTVPPLIEVLGGKDESSHTTAATALGELGPAAKEAIPLLLVHADESDDYQRSFYMTALKKIGPPEGAGVQKVIDLLKDGRVRVRAAAAESLAGVVGDNQADVLAALKRTLLDSNPDVRKSAAMALGQFGPGAKTVLAALEEAARIEPIVDVKEVMTDAIKKIRPAAK
jgi:HEAT repeat protein